MPLLRRHQVARGAKIRYHSVTDLCLLPNRQRKNALNSLLLRTGVPTFLFIRFIDCALTI
jgi:hypothetical protein